MAAGLFAAFEKQEGAAMNAYVVFVLCAGASAIAAGVGAKAQPSDNE
jgi:hypothetical protein